MAVQVAVETARIFIKTTALYGKSLVRGTSAFGVDALLQKSRAVAEPPFS